MSEGAGHTRSLVETFKESLAEIKADVRDIRNHRFTDALWILGAIGAVAIVLGSMMIAAYMAIESRIDELSTSSTKVETKLDDLIQRIPPAPTAPPSTAPKH